VGAREQIDQFQFLLDRLIGVAPPSCAAPDTACTTTGAAGRSRFRHFPRPAVHPILQVKTETRVLPSLQHVTRSATSEHLMEFLGFPISSSSSLPASVLNQGSFPPLALPNIVSRTSPSATPWCPAQLLAERQLAVRAATPRGFPCCHLSSSFMHAIVTTPAEPVGACFAHFPIDDSLPRLYVGSASALAISRPAQRSLALRPA
jgi:hypothetical protein